MGTTISKEGKVDECTSNSSLSNIRYVITEKPKWKVFKKKEIRQLPQKGCPCGNNGPCKQKITPKGVTIHYPQKKKKFSASFGPRIAPAKPQRGYFSSTRIGQRAKLVYPKKLPMLGLNKIKSMSPFA